MKDVIKQMEVSGEVRRPYVGVSFTEDGNGLAVVRIQPGSPAERSGIQLGDVVIEINGTPIRKAREFFEAVGYQMGVVLKLKILRGTTLLDIKVST